MARRIAPRTYLYRQHTITAGADSWQITGAAVQSEALTLSEAQRIIDAHPATPPKATRREAGRKGATVMHSIYRLVPVEVNNFAIVNRQTGEIKNYLSGKHW